MESCLQTVHTTAQKNATPLTARIACISSRYSSCLCYDITTHPSTARQHAAQTRTHTCQPSSHANMQQGHSCSSHPYMSFALPAAIVYTGLSTWCPTPRPKEKR
mmetsp:Transcript_32620/g.94322  ORF Transcript_32620/g.94322 Transcript_32620/m.94322 type:complete len:104 (-) Transcript_32620:62-373(-)